jgi:hypothetical protein
MIKHLQMGPVYIKSPGAIWIFNYLGLLFNSSKLMLALGGIVLIIYAIYFFRNKLWQKKWQGLISADMFIVLWFAVPLIIIAVKSIISVPVLTYRNLIICLPALILMTSRGIYNLPYKKRINDIVALTLCFVFLFHLLFVFKYYSKPQKDQFRQSVEYIVKNDANYPNSIVIGYAWHKQYFDYYFHKFNSPIKVSYNLGLAKDTTVFGRLIDTTKAKYIWYITGHVSIEKEFFEYISKKAEIIDEQQFYSASVMLLKPRKVVL